MDPQADLPSQRTPDDNELPLLEALPTIAADDEVLDVLVADSSPDEQPQERSDNTITVGDYRLPRWGYSVVWTLLLFGSQLIVGLIVGVSVAVVIMPTGRMRNLDPQAQAAELETIVNRYIVPIATLATLLTSVGVVGVAFRKQTARCIGLRGMTLTQTGLVLLSALPLALLASEVTNCASHLFPNVSIDLFGAFSQQPWPLVFVAACFFPGLGEELFFRGFLSRGLVAHHGVRQGTLLTAFLFGVIHLHPIQACGAFALGIALQFVFLETRSLWGAVLLHTVNNTLAFVAMKYGQDFPIHGFTSVSEKGTIAHTPLPLVVAAIATTAALFMALHRTRTRWLLPNGTEWSRGFVSAEGPRPEVAVRKVSDSLDLQIAGFLFLTYVAFLAALWRYVEI